MRWQANWIWIAGDEAPRNAVVRFRRAFVIDAPIEAPVLHLSADSRYIVYVNGRRIGYGPARNYHFRYEYDSYDLAPFLVVGENVVAVEVLHWGEGTFQYVVGRGGLVAQLDHAGGTLLASDESWRAQPAAAFRRDTPRISCQLPWEEQFDARRDEEGWARAGFDDAKWERATLVGSVGVEPWGELSPRTIPFLTDEPVAPVRISALGEAQRPEVVAALHAAPYIAPGDLSANRHDADALIATLLHVPHAGDITFKRCSLYGAPPRLFVGGQLVELRPRHPDVFATLPLEAGDHLVLLDWHNHTHDLDVTITASGVAGMRVSSPLAGEVGTWAIATTPGDAREGALRASTVAELLACGAAWRPVARDDTPSADVYMDITASTLLANEERLASLPLRVPAQAAGRARQYVIDFGRELVGWIELDVEGAEGATIDVLGFEGVQEGRRMLPERLNNTLRYVCRAGRQQFVSTVRRGLRYLLVAVHSAGAETVLHSAKLRLSTYPWNTQGDFRCSDPRLNQIWDLCAYTLRMCSEDTFTDCPAYEQTLWVGDACHSDVLVHQTVHGDGRMVARNLRLAADSLQRLPIANSQVPSAWEDSLIPNWSWLWALGCENYYQLTGDTAFVRDVYPALAKQAASIEESRNEAGIFVLPGAWHFLDWTSMPDGPSEVPAHESCLAVGALRATAALAHVAGAGHEAARWHAAADELSDAVNRVFWLTERGAYADLWRDGVVGAAISQPTNICALLAGVAQGERAEAILPHLLDPSEGWLASGTPWMYGLAGILYAERGRMAEVLQGIRARWGDMLDKGATTTWETFSGFEPNGVWTRSWCHAWSALPAYLLPAFVLGVRPLEPGFSRVLVAPQLCDLAWAEARVPTPHGIIRVRAERGADGVQVEVDLPPGVTAEYAEERNQHG